MNAKAVAAVLGVAGVAGLLYLADANGYNRALAQGNAQVVALQTALADQQAEITRQESLRAEAMRATTTAQYQRIAAIEVTDAQSDQIENLKTELAHLIKRQQESTAPSGDIKNLDPADLVIIRRSFIERVWREAVRGGQQTRSQPASTIPAQPATTASLDRRTDWHTADNRSRRWCDSEKCCRPIQHLPDRIQHTVASLPAPD